MSSGRIAYRGVAIFDGAVRYEGHALVIEDDTITAIIPEEKLDLAIKAKYLSGGMIVPGFVDLQVNGGGGVMFNDCPSVDTLQRMAQAHARLGATSILPTLITDMPEKTLSAIDAAVAAVLHGVPGILGLHLEGPHLAGDKCGAHNPDLIRSMTDKDIHILCNAAQRLPVVMITLAPENVRSEQIIQLVSAGIIVSIGHSNATYEQVAQAVAAGATCTTHLFNAMRPLGSREPGVVGATLVLGELSAGLIADGVHVHPSSIRAALRGKCGPGQIFLVSDAMAVAGTSKDHFELGGRLVTRSDGRLVLQDGTLAGADLDLLTAVRNLSRWGILDVDTAIAMATAIPADVIGCSSRVGTLKSGGRADFQLVSIYGSDDSEVWQSGYRVPA